ncbi:MAG: AAA family ATPase [Gammaproteobacteria bacterium]|nr:AAA family ATPase [Gammaproteobacteria bacterium]
MNEFAIELTNVMTPDYLDKLGMTKAPFSDLYDQDVYYENDNKINIQKKIAHLLEYTNLVLFIQGAEGVGKTTILKQRILSAKEDWSMCYLSAKDYKTNDALVEKLAAELGLSLSNELNTSATSLQEQLDILCKEGKLPVLIIDDIEQLSETLIPMLSSFVLARENNRPRLRLIIAGEDIPPSLLNVIPKEDDEANLKYLPVLPLSEIETGEYIKYKIKAAGYDRGNPFTANVINKIYLDAKGFPKIINQLANHFLSQFSQGKIEKPQLLNFSENNNILKLAAAALSLLVIIIVISISLSTDQDEHDIAQTQQTKAIGIPAAKNIDQNASQNTSQIKPQDAGSQKANSENKISAEPLTSAPKITISDTPNNSTIEKTTEKESVSIALKQPEPKVEKPKLTVQNKPAPLQPTAPTSSKKLPAMRTHPDTIRWINKQNPKHFTLQLIGSSQKSSVENFIKEHKLGKNAYIFSTDRKGTPWFSVIYKSYSQRKAAQNAAESLPGSLKQVKPWIRTFAHIKRDMK